jgi:uncharacterized membrane-anchored protein
MDMEELGKRRIERIESRRVSVSLKMANKARDERNAILKELKTLPLKNLRAIHKAAKQTFNLKP